MRAAGEQGKRICRQVFPPGSDCPLHQLEVVLKVALGTAMTMDCMVNELDSQNPSLELGTVYC